MSVALLFPGVQESVIQDVDKKLQETREFESPVYQALRGNLEKKKVGEKGLKIVYNGAYPGGHSFPTAIEPDWNEPYAPDELAAYVYPLRYRLPMIFDHAILRDFANKEAGAFQSMVGLTKMYMRSASKRMERMVILEGKGSLAYSTSALAVGNGLTMNCDTTPASAPGHTKGAKWLERGQEYQAINETTGVPRGRLRVVTEGKTSCVVDVLSGSVASGDPICNINGYNKAWRGLGWLISGTNRVVQGINTANAPDFNSNEIDLANTTLSAATLEDLLTGLQIRSNKKDARNGKVVIAPPGQMSLLRKQGQNLRMYTNGYNIVQGIASDFETDGVTSYIEASDMDEDRLYFLVYQEFGILEELPLDVMMMDGNEWHQLMGANNSGSERYQRGIGTDGNIYRRGNAMGSGVIKRASTTGVQRQVDF